MQPAPQPEPGDDGLVARQTGGTATAHVTGMAVRYGAAMLTTRLLGPILFGTFVQATTLVQLAAQLGALGLAPGVLPHVQRARGARAALRAVVRRGAGLALVGAAAMAVVLFALAPTLGARVFQDPELEGMLRVLAVGVVLTAVAATLLALLQGLLGVRTQAWIDRVLAPGATLVVLGLTWLQGWGVTGVLAAALAGPAAAVLSAGWSLARRLRAEPEGPASPPLPPATARGLLRSSWPLLGSTTLVFLMSWADLFLLGILRPGEGAEVGQYGLCLRLLLVVMVIHEGSGPVFLAHASQLAVRGAWDPARALYRRTTRWSVWSGLALGTAFITFDEPILRLFGEEFTEGASLLGLLALGKVATTLTGPSGKLLIAAERQRLNLVNMTVLVAVKLGLGWLWIPEHGALGAAWASLASAVLINLAQAAELWVLHRAQPWGRDTLVALLGAAGLVAAFRPVRDGLDLPLGWLLPLAGFGLAWAGLYRVAAWTPDDRQLFAGLERR